MTPRNFPAPITEYIYTYMYSYSNKGLDWNHNTDYTLRVRPVTSLKSCVKWSSGDGTAANPYTIVETESGC